MSATPWCACAAVGTAIPPAPSLQGFHVSAGQCWIASIHWDFSRLEQHGRRVEHMAAWDLDATHRDVSLLALGPARPLPIGCILSMALIHALEQRFERESPGSLHRD